MASISHVFGALIALVIAHYTARTIYRIYFHPLSKFPGPKFHAATRIPYNLAIIKGTRDQLFQDLHRKYGQVVRVAHDELSFIEPSSWKDIHGHGTRGTRGSRPIKAPTRYGNTPNNAPSLMISSDDAHSRQRKIFAPAFSERALKEQEPLFHRYTDQLVAVLRKRIEADPNAKLDMVRLYNFTAFDVMGDLTFGEPLHMLDNGEYDPWVTQIFGSLKAASFIGILMAYPWLWRLFKAIVPESVNKKKMEHFNRSVDRVRNRIENGRQTEGVDLWDLVLKQKEGRTLSNGEMDVNASVFMMAGTETSATLLSGMTYMLLRNPEWMKKLNDEIRGEFASAADMTMERLAALPYLAACMKETFRIYPPVPLGLARLTPPSGSTIGDHFVPPDTLLSIPQHAMYMDERNFKRPNEFLPQRWMGDSEFDSDQKQCLQPFSVGSRDCIGKNLAYHEMRLIIAKTYYHFDIELCPESNDWVDQKIYILWEKKPLLCKLRAVN